MEQVLEVQEKFISAQTLLDWDSNEWGQAL